MLRYLLILTLLVFILKTKAYSQIETNYGMEYILICDSLKESDKIQICKILSLKEKMWRTERKKFIYQLRAYPVHDSIYDRRVAESGIRTIKKYLYDFFDIRRERKLIFESAYLDLNQGNCGNYRYYLVVIPPRGIVITP